MASSSPAPASGAMILAQLMFVYPRPMMIVGHDIGADHAATD
jgi:hypothetical protein